MPRVAPAETSPRKKLDMHTARPPPTPPPKHESVAPPINAVVVVPRITLLSVSESLDDNDTDYIHEPEDELTSGSDGLNIEGVSDSWVRSWRAQRLPMTLSTKTAWDPHNLDITSWESYSWARSAPGSKHAAKRPKEKAASNGSGTISPNGVGPWAESDAVRPASSGASSHCDKRETGNPYSTPRAKPANGAATARPRGKPWWRQRSHAPPTPRSFVSKAPPPRNIACWHLHAHAARAAGCHWILTSKVPGAAVEDDEQKEEGEELEETGGSTYEHAGRRLRNGRLRDDGHICETQQVCPGWTQGSKMVSKKHTWPSEKGGPRLSPARSRPSLTKEGQWKESSGIGMSKGRHDTHSATDHDNGDRDEDEHVNGDDSNERSNDVCTSTTQQPHHRRQVRSNVVVHVRPYVQCPRPISEASTVPIAAATHSLTASFCWFDLVDFFRYVFTEY